MPTVRRMALPVLAVSLFLLSAGAISSSTFARAQEPAQADHKIQPFTLSSPDFRDGGPLPSSSEYGGGFGCNGEDIAPTLKWKNVPAQTSSFALLMNDVDAAVAGGFHHWIVYKYPRYGPNVTRECSLYSRDEQPQYSDLFWALPARDRREAPLYLYALCAQH